MGVIALCLLYYPYFPRKFRVIPAEAFLRTFASDRSHMKKPNGEWIKMPPPYSPIRTTGKLSECIAECGLWNTASMVLALPSFLVHDPAC